LETAEKGSQRSCCWAAGSSGNELGVRQTAIRRIRLYRAGWCPSRDCGAR
jgi:hypothetical protein